MQNLPRVVPALLLAAVFAGCAAADNPAPREVPTYTIEEFVWTTKLRGASFSPDGEKILGGGGVIFMESRSAWAWKR